MDAIYRTIDGLYRTFIDGPVELIVAGFLVTAAGWQGYDPGRMTAEPWKAEVEEAQSAASAPLEGHDATPRSQPDITVALPPPESGVRSVLP
jgi:hypothetical protein